MDLRAVCSVIPKDDKNGNFRSIWRCSWRSFRPVEEVLDGIAVGDGVMYSTIMDGAEDVAVFVEEDTGLNGLDEKKSLREFFNMASQPLTQFDGRGR